MAMGETPPRCPDCGVTVEAMTLRSSGGHKLTFVSEERDYSGKSA